MAAKAMPDQAMMAAIAVTRFGLGARPGEIEAATGDPAGWLVAQIRREGADQPVTAPLPAAPPPQPPKPPAPTPVAAGAAMAAGPVSPGTSAQAQMAQGSTPGGMMAGPPAMAPNAPPQLVPPRTDFGDGKPLPTMQQAWRTFQEYRVAIREAKADDMARREATIPINELAAEEALARARLAVMTPDSFRERWTLFWCNHFTVAAKNQDTMVAVGPFEREAIRPHVFKSFAELLLASSMHPGMLLYLDQQQSIGPDSLAAQRRRGGGGLNENLGREIMELHSVGADAGYTQADVTEFARALTGWSVGNNPNDPPGSNGAFLYRDNFHEPGERTVMGKKYYDDGGKQAGQIILDLAAKPQTARRMAHKIAAHFVADDPPPALVARLEAVWTRTNGDLGRVAEALVTSRDAYDPAPLKLKTPNEFIISSYRAAEFAPVNPARDVVNPLNSLGQRPFGAPQPNGWSDVALEWAAPDAIVKRLTWAQGFANAHAPQGAPPDVAKATLGERLGEKSATAIARAESRPEAFALLLMSPEFQRR